MGRVAAVDFGLKRIGLAISDERKKIAFPLAIVEGGKRAVDHIRKALGEKLAQTERIVIGLPLLMSGEEGEMAKTVRAFAAELAASLNIPVEPVDERLSSKMADKSLQELRLTRKERTERLDTTTAVILLQSYLDRAV